MLVGEQVGRSTTSELHCVSWLIAGGNPRRPAAKLAPMRGRREDGKQNLQICDPVVSDYGCQHRYDLFNNPVKEKS